MKKAIIIMTMIMSILLFDKIHALSMDGTFSHEYSLGGSGPHLTRLDDTPTSSDRYVFSQGFATQNDNFAVFSINGIEWTQTDYDDQQSLTFFLNGINTYVEITLVTTGTWQKCEWQNNMIVCPLETNTIASELRFNLQWPTTFSSMNYWSIEFHVNNYVTTWKTGNQNVIDNQNQNYNDFKNQNATYSDEINTDMNGANETIQYSQNEEQLLDSLDMNTSILDDININAGASAFIWDIVEGVRGMNPAIITLMTSILGLGIAKMILNR